MQNDTPERKGCTRKQSFPTRVAARRSARIAGKSFDARFKVYPCDYCGQYHLATAREAMNLGSRAKGKMREREAQARRNGRMVIQILEARKGKGVANMAIEMIPVKSSTSNVRAIGLDGARLLVQFDNGVYECVRVDGSDVRAAAAYENFLNAASKGGYYHSQIRRMPAVWEVRKLEKEVAAHEAARADYISEPRAREAAAAADTETAASDAEEAGAGAGVSLESVGEARTGFEPNNLTAEGMRKAEERGPHNFVLDTTVSYVGQGADFCSVCGLPRKHPLHFQTPSTASVATAQDVPTEFDPSVHVVETHKFSLGPGDADVCLRCGLPPSHLVHFQNPQAEKSVENEAQGWIPPANASYCDCLGEHYPTCKWYRAPAAEKGVVALDVEELKRNIPPFVSAGWLDGGRYLPEVIERILRQIPRSEEELRAKLRSLESSAAHSAPEYVGNWWAQVGSALESALGNPVHFDEAWKRLVYDIFMGTTSEVSAPATLESLRPSPTFFEGWPIVGRCGVCDQPLIRVRLAAEATIAAVDSRVICPTCVFSNMEQIRELSTPTHYDEDALNSAKGGGAQ